VSREPLPADARDRVASSGVPAAAGAGSAPAGPGTNGAGPVSPADPASRPRGRNPLARNRARTGFLLSLPALILVTVFFVLPLILVAWMSLNNWPLIGRATFIGLQNYRNLGHDKIFGHALLFTAEYTIIVTPIQLVLGYLMAVMVRSKLRGVGFFRTVYFMPVVTGFAATAYVFLVMLTPGVGVVNTVIKGLGLSNGQTNWLTSPGLALIVAVLLITWKTIGIAMILFMAAMQAVPGELYEAAKVDGAGWWRREARITVPLIRRTTALILVLTVAGSFLAFDQFFILTQGGPNNETLTAVLWIYTTAFVQYRTGYAGALSIVLLVLLILLSIVQIRALRRGDEAN
jgi:multiple sugar transport system permease protein